MKDVIDQLYPGVDPEFFSDDDISSEQWERMTLQQRTCVFCGRDDNHTEGMIADTKPVLLPLVRRAFERADLMGFF